jgi:hypothetical protein
MMGLARMQQDQVVAALQQELVEIFPVAAGGFQPDADLGGRALQLREGAGKAGKAGRGVGDRKRRPDGAFVQAQDTDETGFAPDINADDILKRGASP